MVFTFLEREGRARGNPCKGVRLRAKSKRHPAMTEDEYRALRFAMVEEVEKAKTPKKLRDSQELLDLADVLWLSGLRFIDATRVAWGDVDFEEKVWTIRSPENKGGVIALPIHSKVLSTLSRRRLLGVEGPFPAYWHLSNLWKAFKERHPQFGGWSWHRMRHAFVTRLRGAGLDAAARALARHHSQSMSDHYTQLGMEDLRRSLEIL